MHFWELSFDELSFWNFRTMHFLLGYFSSLQIKLKKVGFEGFGVKVSAFSAFSAFANEYFNS